MLIVETPIFTKRLREVLDDDQYRLLQISLTASPDAGQVIRGSGGLRKLRWSGSGRGKRGGARLIYRWFPEYDKLLMVFVFLKNEREDLTAQQVRLLRGLVEGELK